MTNTAEEKRLKEKLLAKKNRHSKHDKKDLDDKPKRSPSHSESHSRSGSHSQSRSRSSSKNSRSSRRPSPRNNKSSSRRQRSHSSHSNNNRRRRSRSRSRSRAKGAKGRGRVKYRESSRESRSMYDSHYGHEDRRGRYPHDYNDGYGYGRDYDYNRGPPRDPYYDDYGRRDPYYNRGGGGGRDEYGRSMMSSHFRDRDREYDSYGRSSRDYAPRPTDGRRSRDRSRSARRTKQRSASKSPPRISRSSSIRGRKSRKASHSPSKSRSKSPNSDNGEADALTREQRTIFLSQLVLRTTARDIKNYFKYELKIPVKDVIFLKDKHAGAHRGLAYVELKNLDDVALAVEKAHMKQPDWQRFPIQVRASEAEKNHAINTGIITNPSNLTGDQGKGVDVQQVYVGNIERIVTSQQLQYLFSQFGNVTKVALQIDPQSGLSKGFAFLSFDVVEEANLAIQTMQGQLLAGRPLRI